MRQRWVTLIGRTMMMVRILVLGGATMLWGAVHSWLASAGAKRWAGRLLGPKWMRAYRLGYNAFALVSFAPVLYLMRFLPDRLVYDVQPPWLWIMLAAQAIAVCGLVIGLLQTDPWHFVGLSQVAGGPSSPGLVRGGLYRLVRHPLYLSGLIVIWLLPIMSANLLAVIAGLTVYIFVGASLEERRLLQEYGEAYAEYARHTPMIIPGFKLRGGGAGSHNTSASA